jgi:hypothetical protein
MTEPETLSADDREAGLARLRELIGKADAALGAIAFADLQDAIDALQEVVDEAVEQDLNPSGLDAALDPLTDLLEQANGAALEALMAFKALSPPSDWEEA